LLKYLNKNVTETAITLTMLHYAKATCDKYGSKAADDGTDVRYGKHVIQCLLNKMNGATEMPDTMAAIGMLGYTSFQSSVGVQLCFVQDAVNYVAAAGGRTDAYDTLGRPTIAKAKRGRRSTQTTSESLPLVPSTTAVQHVAELSDLESEMPTPSQLQHTMENCPGLFQLIEQEDDTHRTVWQCGSCYAEYDAKHVRPAAGLKGGGATSDQPDLDEEMNAPAPSSTAQDNVGHTDLPPLLPHLPKAPKIAPTLLDACSDDDDEDAFWPALMPLCETEETHPPVQNPDKDAQDDLDEEYWTKHVKSMTDAPTDDVKPPVQCFASADAFGGSHAPLYKYKNKDTNKLCTEPYTQHMWYATRGAALKEMSLWEFVSTTMVERTEREDKKEELEDDAAMLVDTSADDRGQSDTKRMTKRRDNARFTCEHRNPLSEYYQVKLRSKYVCPVWTKKPPRPPQPMLNEDTAPASYTTAQCSFAEQMLAVFCPWWTQQDLVGDTTGRVLDMPRAYSEYAGTSWEKLSQWMAENCQSSRGRAVNAVIFNLSENMGGRHSQRIRQGLAKFRGRSSTVWAKETCAPLIDPCLAAKYIGNRVYQGPFKQPAIDKDMIKQAKLIDKEINQLDSTYYFPTQGDEKNEEFINAQTEMLDNLLYESTKHQEDAGDPMSAASTHHHHPTKSVVDIPRKNMYRPYDRYAYELFEHLKTRPSRPPASSSSEEQTMSTDSDQPGKHSQGPRLESEPSDDSETDAGKGLNQEQRRVFDTVAAHVAQNNAQLVDSVKPDPLLLFVTGGAGTGKTTLMKHLRKHMRAHHAKFVCAAALGSAVSHMGTGAETIHTMFAMPRNKKRADMDGKRGKKINKQDDRDSAWSNNLSTEIKPSMNSRFDGVKYVFLDEMSCISAQQLTFIHNRILQIQHGQDEAVAVNDQPFGGLSILGFGDMAQINPVGGISLIEALLDHHGIAVTKPTKSKALKAKTFNSTAPADTPVSMAGSLFAQFTRFTLTEQMRARTCPIQAHMTNEMRKATFNFPKPFLQMLVDQELSVKDLQDDLTMPDSSKTWLEAPILVGGNKERAVLNKQLAVAYAKRTGQPLIRWVKNLKGEFWTTTLSEHQRDYLFETHPELCEYFCVGAPAFVTENFHPAESLANGVSCRLDSLMWPSTEVVDSDAIERAEAEIAQAKPGQIVTLPFQPAFVCIRLPKKNADKAKWPSSWNLNSDGDEPFAVVPCDLQSDWTDEKDDIRIAPVHSEHIPSGHIKAKPFRVELGFAMTFNKAQGMTKSRVVREHSSFM